MESGLKGESGLSDFTPVLLLLYQAASSKGHKVEIPTGVLEGWVPSSWLVYEWFGTTSKEPKVQPLLPLVPHSQGWKLWDVKRP